MLEVHKIVLQERWEDARAAPGTVALQPDQRDGSVYLLTPELKTAIKVALVTFRPLLLRGDPGTGKSSLAAYIARNLNWRYYEHVVTARTEARDLLYTYDAVRRLSDAQVPDRPRPFTGGFEQIPAGETLMESTILQPDRNRLDPSNYVEPGVFWWAINRESAARRGLPQLPPGARPPLEPNAALNRSRDPHCAVVLIDEIDKADPDVPNSLLVALGSNVFQIAESGRAITPLARSTQEGDADVISPFLVVITTNEERSLPRAFLRRCITHKLELPREEAAFVTHMTSIAERHRRREKLPHSKREKERAEAVAHRLFKWRDEAGKAEVRPPGIAEYLDAVRACRTLHVNPNPDDPQWALLENVTLRKSS